MTANANPRHPVHAPLAEPSAPQRVPVSEPGDRGEREADSAAAHVLSGGEHPRLAGARGSARSVELDAARPRGTGEALDAGVAREMGARFGHDFSRVRVHADGAAAQAADALGARAYAFGRDIVFGAGEYRPAQPAGRRLLAHELAHVVQQQRGGRALVQRDEKKTEASKPAAKIDVSIVLSEDEQDMAEGSAYAKTVLRVTDADDAAAKLKALNAPIGRLYVVSHSSAAGQVEFISSIGTISWVPIRELAQKLKGQVSIDDVDFRGCKMGNAAGAMESFRQTVGAQSTRGSNCWTFILRATPLTIEGVPVTSPSQIPKERKKAFDKAMLDQLAGMRSEDGKPVQNCLLGLAPGAKANAKNLAKVWELYWANGGNLVASWGSPDYNKNWQEGSICTKDMTASTTPCAIVETKAPATTPPAPGGKTGALDAPLPGVEVGGGAAPDEGVQEEEAA